MGHSRAGIAVCVLTCLLIAHRASGGEGRIRRKQHPIFNQYIIGVTDASALAGVRALAGASVLRSWSYASHGFVIRGPEALAVALSRDPRVSLVEEDELSQPHLACPVTQKYPSQSCADGSLPWQLDRLDDGIYSHLDGRYVYCYTGSNVRIYVVDSGVRGTHDDFSAGNGQSRVIAGKNYLIDGSANEDLDGHGTIVASAAAGRRSGAAKDATVVSVRVERGQSYHDVADTSRLIDALNWVNQDHDTHPGPAVVIYAREGFQSALFAQAVQALITDGIVFVASIGNSGTNGCAAPPQALPGVLTVAASTKSDALWASSSTGNCVSLVVPGSEVGAGYQINDTAYNCNPGWFGTSVAAGVAAGVAAVYMERYWGQPPANIINAMVDASLKDMLHGAVGVQNRLIQGTCGNANTVGTACPPTVRRPIVSHQMILPGQSATLSIETAPLNNTYQWYVGNTPGSGTAIGGATASQVTVTPAVPTSYWVRMTNGGQTEDSDTAAVSVCQAPNITRQPLNAPAVSRWYNSAVDVVATGTGLAYQWYSGDTLDMRNPVAGATSSSLVLQAFNSEKYWVRIAGTCGSADSKPGWINVYPQITAQPQPASVTYGSTAKFGVSADGTFLHYTWRSGNGAAVAGAPDAPVYLMPSLTANTSVWCDVTSGPNFATTSTYAAPATVCEGVTITSTSIFPFGLCRDIVLGTTGAADTYQWYQGPRGDTSMPVQSGSPELYACPSVQTSYWLRIVAGSCVTDSQAVLVP